MKKEKDVGSCPLCPLDISPKSFGFRGDSAMANGFSPPAPRMGVGEMGYIETISKPESSREILKVHPL